MPDLVAFREPELEPTFAEAAKRWQASRVDVAEATAVQHRTALNRALPLLGARRLGEISASDVAELVAALHADGKARESIRKTVTATAMVFDYAGVSPNPARDRVIVKLPRDESEEPNPPSAEHVEEVFRLIPAKHRLALLFLDWSGARVSAIDRTTVGDYDAARQRVRLRRQTMKTRKALWIDLPPVLAEAIEATLPPRLAVAGRSATRRLACSPTRVPTPCGQRSRRRAVPPGSSRSGARTTCVTGASRSCICAESPGRGSASGSGSGTSPSPPTSTRTSSWTSASSTTRRCWLAARERDPR